MSSILLFIMVALIALQGTVPINRRKMFREISTLSGLGNATSNCELWNYVVQNRFVCGRACLKSDRCVRFKYDEDGNCSAYCDRDTDIGVTQGDQSEVYVCVPDVGYPCTDAEQCVLQYSTCNDGVCTCQVGYSYNPGTNACVIGCSKYGSDYFSYKDTVIKGFNIRKVSNASIEDCKNECSTTPECRSFDYKYYGDRFCELNKAGWFEVEPSARREHYRNFILFQKNCDI